MKTEDEVRSLRSTVEMQQSGFRVVEGTGIDTAQLDPLRRALSWVLGEDEALGAMFLEPSAERTVADGIHFTDSVSVVKHEVEG